MTTPNLGSLRNKSTRGAMRDAIALMAQAGLTLARWQQKMYPEGFQIFCSQVFSVSLARAELLIRHSSVRPPWADASAVDLDDPLAWELLVAGLQNDRSLPEEADECGT